MNKVSKVEKQLKELVELGKEWREFASDSSDAYGWNFERRNDKVVVGCYFATGGNHTAISFGKNGVEVHIGFHNPEKFDLELRALTLIDDIITDARELLKQCEKARKGKKKVEIEKAKKERVDYLKRELDRLQRKKSTNKEVKEDEQRGEE